MCIEGERACPPEDCHGPIGYTQLLEILGNPEHVEFDEMNQWLKGHHKNYFPFNPEEFDPKRVLFRNPKKQSERLFTEFDE